MQTHALPLGYVAEDLLRWSGRRDLNPRPSPWQGDALPLRHFRLSDHPTTARGTSTLPRLRGVCPPLAVHVRRCRGAELNCRHRDFQSRALPPELPRREANLQYSLIWRRVRVKAPSGAFGLLPHSNPHSQKGEGFVGLRDGGWWHSGFKVPAFGDLCTTRSIHFAMDRAWMKWGG